MSIRSKLPDALRRALANPVAGRTSLRGPGGVTQPAPGALPGAGPAPLSGPLAGLVQRARQASAGLAPRARVDFAALAAARRSSLHGLEPLPSLDFGLAAVGREAAAAARAQFQERLDLIARQLGTAPRRVGGEPAAPPPPDTGKQLRPPGEAAREAMGWGSEQGGGGGSGSGEGGGPAHGRSGPQSHPHPPVGGGAGKVGGTGMGMGADAAGPARRPDAVPHAQPESAATAPAALPWAAPPAPPAPPVARSPGELAALAHLGLGPGATDHEILGVAPGADRAALGQARTRRLLAAHPDKLAPGAAPAPASAVIGLVQDAFARLAGAPPAG